MIKHLSIELPDLDVLPHPLERQLLRQILHSGARTADRARCTYEAHLIGLDRLLYEMTLASEPDPDEEGEGVVDQHAIGDSVSNKYRPVIGGLDTLCFYRTSSHSDSEGHQNWIQQSFTGQPDLAGRVQKGATHFFIVCTPKHFCQRASRVDQPLRQDKPSSEPPDAIGGQSITLHRSLNKATDFTIPSKCEVWWRQPY